MDKEGNLMLSVNNPYIIHIYSHNLEFSLLLYLKQEYLILYFFIKNGNFISVWTHHKVVKDVS